MMLNMQALCTSTITEHFLILLRIKVLVMAHLPLIDMGTYHSHGAESGPDWDDENFSDQDIATYKEYFGNGYLITPKGVKKKYNVLTNKISEMKNKGGNSCGCKK